MKTSTLKTAFIGFATTKWFRYCLLACIAFVGAMYIWQVTMSTSYGYRVDHMEQAIAQLEQENEQLQNQVSSLRSIDRVMARVQMLGLVKVDDVRYIHSDDSVAVNR